MHINFYHVFRPSESLENYNVRFPKSFICSDRFSSSHSYYIN